MRDTTVLGSLTRVFFFAGCLFHLPSAGAQNPVLREVEVRSFLGESLNLRIALAASTERSSTAICQSVIDGDPRENALRASDLQLTMVELRNTRYLQVRSRAAFNEPVARFSLRIGCPGEPLIDQEFTVLLDPPPFTTLPVSPLESTATDSRTTLTSPPGRTIPVKSARARAKPVVPASGTWSVNEGDSMARLAKGIHPKNRARQRQYIAVLRELNPPIADTADDAPLTPGTQLALPDLHTLSGIMPRAAVVTPAPDTPAAAKNAMAEKPVARGTAQAVAKPSAAATAPVPTKPAAPKATPPDTIKPAPAAAKPAPIANSSPRGESFQLRLSGSEMDLSRSRNVTDEQRRQLREKQLMLDADDQVAALLALKNTVKQLEQRLNEMQLKLAAAPSMRPTAPTPPPSVPLTVPVTPATPAAAPAQKPPAAVAPPAAPQAPVAAPAIVAAAPQATPAPALSAPEKKPVPATSPIEKPALPEPSFIETMTSYLPSPLVAGGIIAGLLALLAAWAWSRRANNSNERDDSVTPDAPRAEATPAENSQTRSARARRALARRTPARDAESADAANQQVEDGPSTDQPPGEAFMPTSRSVASDMDDAARGDAEFARFEADAAGVANETIAAAHHQVDAPVIFDDTPDRFEVDTRPATTVDFLVGMDEKLPEDRVRRLQYMHERYPELKSNTVSIDDADSVINAARLYYDEADKGDGRGRDRASELLTFAVEERPQEIRFWLAQFEICRLENMAAEFTAMAGKFHVLFSHTPAWPMVRHIGHELDPGNPLFAAGGSPLLAGEMRFDPIAENWLNAPMDFTSEALMSDLRLALLDDHGVSRADFESITARLSASAGAVAT